LRASVGTLLAIRSLRNAKRTTMEHNRVLAALTFVTMLFAPDTAAAYTLKRTPTDAQVRWYAPRVVLKIDPQLERWMPSGGARAAAVMAADAWRGLPGVPEIEIAAGAPPAYDPSRRGNGIYLVSDWPYEPQHLAITVVTYMPSGAILGVDVLINADKSLALLDEGADDQLADHHDLGAVLTHELGHVLGLDESEADEHATMWPYVAAGEQHQRSLADDDEAGVIAAYCGAPLATHADCSVVGRLGGRGGSLGGALALLAVVVLGARRAGRAQPTV
jgi:hypothetical protein